MRAAIRLLPLLILYAGFVLVASEPELVGDESRYLMFARNLSQGFYSPPHRVNLANGPGYPLLLLPFVLVDAPWIWPRLFNALLLFGAMVYCHHTIRIQSGERAAWIAVVLLGLYVPFFRYLHVLLTETFAVFLVCGFSYHLCRAVRDTTASARHHLIAASGFLGWLALTKVIIGYVVTAGLLIGLAFWVVRRDRAYARVSGIAALALCICVPYLAHTYRITGKPFYWGTYGGVHLYWMSTPHAGEHGDWKANRIEQLLRTRNADLIDNHRAIFEATSELGQVEWDTRFRRAAFENIRNHPTAYLGNWLANVGRMLFNYPYSYEQPTARILFYALPNGVLLLMLGISVALAWRRRERIPPDIAVLLLFIVLTFGAHSLVAVFVRHARLLVPVLAIWIAFAMPVSATQRP